MNEENRNKRSNNKGLTIYEVIVIVLAIFFVIYWVGIPKIPPTPRVQTPRSICQSNMKFLGLAIQMYADENSGSYPLPEKWCDLVSPYLGDSADKMNLCPAVKEYKYHYAMNPNCKPNSPPDTVLLFETQNSGLNLSGGLELLTTDNHGGTGCNIVFNDGSSTYIKKEEIPNLKWNAERKNE